jgi:hypothetical protein
VATFGVGFAFIVALPFSPEPSLPTELLLLLLLLPWLLPLFFFDEDVDSPRAIERTDHCSAAKPRAVCAGNISASPNWLVPHCMHSALEATLRV